MPKDAAKIGQAVQGRLFESEIESSVGAFPEVSTSAETVLDILRGPSKLFGLDFEFQGSRITVLGLSDGIQTVGVWWKPEYYDWLREAFLSGAHFVGHSICSAEKALLEQFRGESWPISQWDDSMVSHYMLNSVLCKAPGKEEEEDSSMGFMDLWTCNSLVLDVPQWKYCRGLDCFGPCPRHAPLEYCATDAWASLASFVKHQEMFAQIGVSHAMYRELLELGELLDRMTTRGIRVDMELVKKMESQFEARKCGLFPDNQPFNPRSPQQALQWYKKRGLELSSAERDDIRKALQSKLSELGLTETDEIPEDAPELVRVLSRHYEYKLSGKGLDSWFSPKYVSGGRIHPRFIHTGTSTGRLSSSRPNCQNIPARGFGAFVRQAILPEPGCVLVKADFKNLEFRMAAWQGGQNPAELGVDPFQWLLDQVPGKFEEVASRLNLGFSARDLAKMTAHANTNLAGLRLIPEAELNSRSVQAAFRAGALSVYHPDFGKEAWNYAGHVVAFTGSVLAETLFGQATYETRREALYIQEEIFNAGFPVIRAWHRKILRQVEAGDYIRSLTGRVLRLYGDADARAKAAATMHSQGTAADHVQAIMLLFYRKNQIPSIQVHDELVFSLPESWTDDEILDYVSVMGGETWRLPGSLVKPEDPEYPGFRCAASIKRGKNWNEMKGIGTV